MNIIKMVDSDLREIKEIYLEAFPKSERKPFVCLKHSIKKGKAKVFVAKEDNMLCGFIITYPYKNLVLVDYLAVSKKIRSKGTGSLLLQSIIEEYKGKIIVLLIEKIDEKASNYEMRVARKNFYVKNGFSSANLFMNGASGEMEIMRYGGSVDECNFLELMKYALGEIFFRLSHINIKKIKI